MNSKLFIIFILFTFAIQVHVSGAHVHGQAYMTLVLDGSDLQITATMSAYDVVGFEHMPQTDEQHQLIDVAINQLTQVDAWLSIDNGACSLVQTQVSNPFQKSANHEHDHDHEHDHGGKHDHGGDHKHDSKLETGHYDFELNIQYQCSESEDLNQLDVKLGQVFPEISNIEVQWLVNNQQGLSKVTTEQNAVQFE